MIDSCLLYTYCMRTSNPSTYTLLLVVLYKTTHTLPKNIVGTEYSHAFTASHEWQCLRVQSTSSNWSSRNRNTHNGATELTLFLHAQPIIQSLQHQSTGLTSRYTHSSCLHNAHMSYVAKHLCTHMYTHLMYARMHAYIFQTANCTVYMYTLATSLTASTTLLDTHTHLHTALHYTTHARTHTSKEEWHDSRVNKFTSQPTNHRYMYVVYIQCIRVTYMQVVKDQLMRVFLSNSSFNSSLGSIARWNKVGRTADLRLWGMNLAQGSSIRTCSC